MKKICSFFASTRHVKRRWRRGSGVVGGAGLKGRGGGSMSRVRRSKLKGAERKWRECTEGKSIKNKGVSVRSPRSLPPSASSRLLLLFLIVSPFLFSFQFAVSSNLSHCVPQSDGRLDFSLALVWTRCDSSPSDAHFVPDWSQIKATEKTDNAHVTLQDKETSCPDWAGLKSLNRQGCT